MTSAKARVYCSPSKRIGRALPNFSLQEALFDEHWAGSMRIATPFTAFGGPPPPLSRGRNQALLIPATVTPKLLRRRAKHPTFGAS